MKTACSLLVIILTLGLPVRVFSEPDLPVTMDNAVTFSGDQSGGVSYILTLSSWLSGIDTIGLIDLGRGVVIPGVGLTNQHTGLMNVSIGSDTETVRIATAGDSESGLAVSGGSQSVHSHGDIGTEGDYAHGVSMASTGANGGNGADATWTNGDPGAPGADGGGLVLILDERIATSGLGANGSTLISTGGIGGNGGEAGVLPGYVGGVGGAGGAGGAVTLSGGATISTAGDYSAGIAAMSAGGVGGIGGEGYAWNDGTSGARGGLGGNVTLDGAWDVATVGDQSYGLWAKSAGGMAGAGGAGGWAGSSGSGGQAANGGTVSLTSAGSILTEGTASYGLHAQSIGGVGGTGGVSSGLFWSFAGDANSGGSGGTVSVENAVDGLVHTQGDFSHAIMAQSIGGGGGSGSGGLGLIVSMGSSGASGGNGGLVTVLNAGELRTSGEASFGLMAQSVGGGGGDGGGVSGLVSIGGSGSQTSDGGNVAVTNQGTIQTQGIQSHAIFAESVGGGGGNGGRASGFISLGGSGGGGGNAGTVSVINEGVIATEADESYGIFAQSVGGGGGTGGSAASAGVLASVTLGGKGAAGGDAGEVSVEHSSDATIHTSGQRSYGLFAQSVGGGGGDGGYAVSGAVGGGVSLAIGGAAGGGGDGDSVMVAVDGSIRTAGERAYALLAQSVGGGGGTGGFAIAGQIGAGGLSLALGGSGGAGGRGGAVDVDITGNLTTAGAGAHAVLAQSVGGGGGDGGYSIAGSIGGGGGAPAANISVGGVGGTGSVGGMVHLDSSGTVSTAGDDAHAILAQSVGGSGGTGGYSIAASLGGGSSLNMGFGGSGGIGSSGGAVSLGSIEERLSGSVSTIGDRSYGILAQSIGGGGGDGGATITGSLLSPASVSLGFGGSGGSGGFGGLVDVYSNARISTGGSQSHGILAQSVGGGGGSGGLSIAGGVTGFGGLSLAMGGDGGTGNTGGAVKVVNGGTIETAGEYSYGLFAQSVGGSGGAGGSSGAVMVNFSSLIPIPEPYPTGSVNIALSLGGDGGSGGQGGDVQVENGGTILTLEDYSYGILAQSIGGGGGDGGKSVAATANISKPSVPAGETASSQVEVKVDFAMALGGNGGTGNHGGQVDVANTGLTETRGDGAHGIFAQSVGGGGGSGGSARSMILSIDPSNWSPSDPPPDISEKSYSFGATLSLGGTGGGAGNGGMVDVTNAGSIITRGADAYGIIAQSVGGGGGIGGGGYHGLDWQDLGVSEETEELLELLPVEDEGDVHIALGGSGVGGGGTGGAVTVSNIGGITTFGGGSIGLFAQSVGGGGGLGGSGATGSSGSVTLGGSGSSGGAGGNLLINQEGFIETSGVAAHGIFAQSVGGGGGYAGNTDNGISETGIDLTIAGDGGAGGSGGNISVTSAGRVITRGDGAIGILAQSVGGGGGIGGSIGSGFGFAGSAGKIGEGGRVEVVHTGSIFTSGAYAHGILAQSVGGTDLGGEVLVTVAGDITVTGVGSVAVIAQSEGLAGKRNIDFVYQSGTITGNNDGAVKFLDGADNSFLNHGVVTTAGGPAGTAFLMAGGNDFVDNAGAVTGSVDLGAGSNSFLNRLGSFFNSGELIRLGTDALAELLNEGTLSPGGSGQALVTTLIGSITQSVDATLGMELDLATGLSDFLDISGVADLAGELVLGLVNPGMAAEGSYTTTLISAAEGLIDSGLDFVSRPSAVFEYVFSLAENGEDLLLELLVDLVPEGLLPAQSEIADIISLIQAGEGAESFAAVGAKIFSLQSVEELGEAYEAVSDTSDYLLSALASVKTTDQYTTTLVKRMHSVRAAAQAYDGDMQIKQVLRNSVWMESFGLDAERLATGSAMGYRPHMMGTTIGYDRLLADGLLLGASAGTAKTAIDMTESTGYCNMESYFGALFGSLFSELYYVDLAFSMAFHSFANMRQVDIGAETLYAESEHGGRELANYLESGLNLFLGPLMMQPYAGLRFSRLDEDSYEETGLEGAGLAVATKRTDSLLSTLGLRLGLPFKAGTWTVLPEAAIAWDHDFPLGDNSLSVAFSSVPELSFNTGSADFPRDGLAVDCGLTFISSNHASLSASYKGQFREGYTAHSVVGSIRYEF